MKSSATSWLIQDRVWIPLVMLRIGTSDSGSSGHSSFHIFREVWPCSLATPLEKAADRSANTVMPKSLPRGGWICPMASSSSHGSPSGRASGSRYFRSRSESNCSFPAGTGVCVVNTLVANTSSRASAKERFWEAIRSRIRSKIRNAECPSFMW